MSNEKSCKTCQVEYFKCDIFRLLNKPYPIMIDMKVITSNFYCKYYK
jgi:hypothetical protein